jgi:hypothetical protein
MISQQISQYINAWFILPFWVAVAYFGHPTSARTPGIARKPPPKPSNEPPNHYEAPMRAQRNLLGPSGCGYPGATYSPRGALSYHIEHLILQHLDLKKQSHFDGGRYVSHAADLVCNPWRVF